MRRVLLAAALASSASAAAAADLSATATLSSHQLVLGDQIVLSVAIQGSGSAAPKPPLIPDVEIYESGKSQSMTIINGRVSSSVVHTFVLNPRKTGRFVVPAIEVPGAAATPPMVFNVDAPPKEAPPPAPRQAPAPPQPPGRRRPPRGPARRPGRPA